MPYYTESPAEGRKQLLFDQELAVAVLRSPMGGGWIWGTTERGKAVLQEYYGEACPYRTHGRLACLHRRA